MPSLLARISILATAASAFITPDVTCVPRSIVAPNRDPLARISFAPRTKDVSMKALLESGVDPIATSMILGAALLATGALTESVEQDREARKNGKSLEDVNGKEKLTAETAIAENMREVRATIQDAVNAARSMTEKMKTTQVDESEKEDTKVEEDVVEDVKNDADEDAEALEVVEEQIEEAKEAVEAVAKMVEESKKVNQRPQAVVEESKEVKQAPQAAIGKTNEFISDDVKEAIETAAKAMPKRQGRPTVVRADIASLKMQVASRIDSEMERSQKLEGFEDKSKTIVQLKMQTEVKKTPFMMKVVKKTFMPWRKFANL